MGAPVTTYGWDVVFATRTSVVNAGLIDPGPQTFDETVLYGSGSVHAQGNTGRWQLSVGGSGALVNFTVPCSDLRMGSGDKSVAFTDGQFEVQATLELSSTGEPRLGTHNLVVKPAAGAVTVLVATFPQEGFDAYADYAKAAMQSWLDSQLSFPYVLATVALAAPNATGLGSVLTPVTATYAYADVTGGGGVLGILGTVVDGSTTPSGTTPPGTQLLQEVSPDAVTAADTVLIVSADVLAELVAGAASSVTLAGTSRSACPVEELATYPVYTNGPA